MVCFTDCVASIAVRVAFLTGVGRGDGYDKLRQGCPTLDTCDVYAHAVSKSNAAYVLHYSPMCVLQL